MGLKNLLPALSFFLFTSCSSHLVHEPTANRQPASLDNNGEVTPGDDFDPALESWYKGSAETESQQVKAVADIIRQFIETQKNVRQSVQASNERNTPAAKRIAGDLPTPTYATRDVHRKTNGCYQAELNINPDFINDVNRTLTTYNDNAGENPKLALITRPSEAGVFQPSASYDAVVRFSNGHPGNRPDSLADARGFAVKILPKHTLPSEPIAQMDASTLNRATLLDVLTINFPTFFVNDPVKYAQVNQAFLDSALDFKNKISSKAEEFWAIFKAGHFTSLERKLALWVNGSVIQSPLGQNYYSMVPSRLGEPGTQRAVKYSWRPVACSSAEQTEFENDKKTLWPDWAEDHRYSLPPHSPSAVKKYPEDYLRIHALERLRKGHYCFELAVQLYRDPVSTQIEDSTDMWYASESDRTWWTNSVVPGKLNWVLDTENTESRNDYLKRISGKKFAPFIRVARLEIKPVTGDEANPSAFNNKTCEDLSFNPWNGDIEHHKPLGIVSRMKRKVYNASRRERHGLNGISDRETERQ